jgi:hypothetical protein
MILVQAVRMTSCHMSRQRVTQKNIGVASEKRILDRFSQHK